MRVLVALFAATLALAGGFIGGLLYANHHQPRHPLSDTPPPSVIGYFRSLDLCQGNQPTHTEIERTVNFDQTKSAKPEYTYHYRCPDGVTGIAYESTPLVP